MNALRAVLDFELPPAWELKSVDAYSNSYLLFDLDKWTTEWNRAIRGFESHQNLINSIKRIQNPFQLGLFKIQEEKRRNEYNFNAPMVGYHIIHPLDLNTAMKYPLDYRRYGHRNTTVQSDGKHPRFYSDFESAYDKRYNSLINNDETIIIKCEYFSPPKNQGDYYPLYIISLEA